MMPVPAEEALDAYPVIKIALNEKWNLNDNVKSPQFKFLLLWNCIIIIIINDIIVYLDCSMVLHLNVMF